MTQQSQCSNILTLNSQAAKNPVSEFFKQTLRNSGVQLMSNDEPNIITQEQALVVRDINSLLEDQTPERIKQFLDGFGLLIKKEKYMSKALMPTLLRKARSGDLERLVEAEQESFFRILLKVHRLQKEVITILLDELIVTVSEDINDVQHLRLILAQLRYLPHIKDAEKLATQLVDAIDVAPFPSQLEILDSIPEILPDSEYNETAKELVKMLDKGDDLSGAIIDCLNALNINSDVRAQIQDHILAKILTGTSTKLFPVFFDFLMTDATAKTLPGILNKIRNALNLIMGAQDSTKDKESPKLIIFQKIHRSAVNKTIAECWLSTVTNIKTHTDHKPIDLLILIMLHSNTKLKKRNIDVIIRKRVKEGLLKTTLLEQLFEKYFSKQLQKNYFKTLMEIYSNLIRTSDHPLITDFASTLYKQIYTNIDTSYKQETLENIVHLINCSDSKHMTSILNIIIDLLSEIEKVTNYARIFLQLLDKLDSYELKDVKLVFEILCRLTCHNSSLSDLKDKLHMIIRKYLSSVKRDYRQIGIVSAVIYVKHVGRCFEDQSEVSVLEISNIAQLEDHAKEAANTLEMCITSSTSKPELQALFYDQLSSMLFEANSLDKYFLSWLFDKVTQDFQNSYVSESSSQEESSVKFNVNTAAEMESPFCIDITQLTDKNTILLLAPHFRLLRLLHYTMQNGDLQSIDALLGCGVVLPKYEDKDNFDLDQMRTTTDCIFHCINWFREAISAFLSQKSELLRRKILERIDNLIELEVLFKEFLEYVPKTCPEQTFGNKKKKLKRRVEDNKKRGKEEPRQFKFREIDTDLVSLLKYNLQTEDISSSKETRLSLKQLNYILRDYVAKLNLITKNRDLGLSHLTNVTPLQIMTDFGHYSKHIDRHLTEIIGKVGSDDMYQEAFGLIMEVLSLTFSWSGFQHVQRRDLLKDIEKSLLVETQLNSLNGLTNELIEKLATFTEFCKHLSEGVNLIQTLESLHVFAPSQTTRSTIAKTAGKLLNKEWPTQNNFNIEILIKSYLSCANIKSLCGMIATIQDQSETLTTKTSTLEMLTSVTKSNFYVLYRNLCSSLHDRVKSDFERMTNKEHLSQWRIVALTMQGLMTIAKSLETRMILVCFLKKSVAILKIFLTQGIPILEIELKKDTDKVVEILKTFQSSTRFLHHLCCYSKVTKDTSLMAYVPQFKLTLETLIYRVKAALVANGCSEAFWMGNLRNRDLHGEDILSQNTNASEADENEEEMQSDEDLEQVDDDDEKCSSASEVFP